jgi:thymidylate synthase
MRTYLNQIQQILETGVQRGDRTGVGTLSNFGLQGRYHLPSGFPAVTTKKLVWKSMVSELLWFVSGSGNINDLKRIYPHNKLWDLNYADYLRRHGISAPLTPMAIWDGSMVANGAIGGPLMAAKSISCRRLSN